MRASLSSAWSLAGSRSRVAIGTTSVLKRGHDPLRQEAERFGGTGLENGDEVLDPGFRKRTEHGDGLAAYPPRCWGAFAHARPEASVQLLAYRTLRRRQDNRR